MQPGMHNNALNGSVAAQARRRRRTGSRAAWTIACYGE